MKCRELFEKDNGLLNASKDKADYLGKYSVYLEKEIADLKKEVTRLRGSLINISFEAGNIDNRVEAFSLCQHLYNDLIPDLLKNTTG